MMLINIINYGLSLACSSVGEKVLLFEQSIHLNTYL